MNQRRTRAASTRPRRAAQRSHPLGEVEAIEPAEIALVVIAKEPVAGRCKTRLCPPLDHAQAAALAAAALADTLEAVAATPASRRVVALEGTPGDWLPPGFEVVDQGEGALDARLATAFETVAEPALVVGMDTPQLLPADLIQAMAALAGHGVDAVVGGAEDGGYWAIGLREADRRVFSGVPMSSAQTGHAQRARFRTLGLHWLELAAMRDVDTIEDVAAVAALSPQSRFACRFAELQAPADPKELIGAGQ